jgi:hypothetical protein
MSQLQYKVVLVLLGIITQDIEVCQEKFTIYSVPLAITQILMDNIQIRGILG